MRQERIIPEDDEAKEKHVDPRNLLNELSGKEWIKSTVSVWYQRGLGKDHPDTRYERQHPAPFPFRMVERLLFFFTKKGDRVLDPFLGVGSTLKACALTGRIGIGIELVEHWVNLSRKRLESETQSPGEQVIIQGDARNTLKELSDESFDFVVTSPPYWRILNKPPDHRVKSERLNNGLLTRYSDDPKDLANIEDYEEFLGQLALVFRECHRVLKPRKYMAVVVGDFRHKKRFFYYHADTAQRIEQVGFMPKGIIIFIKGAKKLYPYGYPYEYVPNIHHEYIMIFRKENDGG